MARFRLSQAHSFGQVRLKAGRTIADPGNGIAGDFIVNNLSAATVNPGMVPLDGSASAMLAASKFANTPSNPYADGVSSVDA
jgi:hypothetical protein